MGKYKKLVAIIACFTLAVLLLCNMVLRDEEVNLNNQEISKLYLYGDISHMGDKRDKRSVIAFFKQCGNSNFYHATVKIQGTSSLKYQKKNYTIEFFDDKMHELKSAINVGWGAANEYCLKANWIDKTHCRNVVTAKLAAEVQTKYGVLEEAPCNGLIDGFPIELYVNNKFHGIYTWNIPKAAWMFGMDENNPNHIVMCGENWTDAALFYAVPNQEAWSVEVGLENEETWAKFTRLSDFIMNSSDDEFKEKFDEYLDLDAVLNYHILSEFAYLPDNYGKNMLMATYDGKVWYPSLYDLDTSWGTDYTGEVVWDYGNDKNRDCFSLNNLGRRMEILFAQELYDRYFELRRDILTKEHVLGLFNAFDARISNESRSREVARWGDEIPGYDISQIEEYLDYMIVQRDEKYRNLIQ